MLKECIKSVIEQTYTNWELCLADDASTMPEVKKCLKNFEDNPKIKIKYRESNGHISRCTNTAIEMASGEYIAFMDCDDVLAVNALYEVVKLLNFICKIPFFYFLCSFIYSPDSLKLPFISSFSSESISLASFNESIVVSFPFFAYSISFSRMLWRLLRYVKKVITKQTIPINQASVKSNIKPITIEESTYHACY